MYSERDIDLNYIFKIFLKKWKLIVIVSLVCFLLSFVYSSFFATELYRVKTSFVVRNASDNYSYSINELSASRLLVETCAEILDSDEMMQFLSKEIDGKYSPGQLKGAIAIRKTETELMEIYVTADSYEKANEICGMVSAILIPHIRENIIKGCDISGLQEVCGSTSPISPNVSRNCVLAIAVGVFISVLVIIIDNMLNNKISDADEFARRFNIPVLGSIPDLESASKGGYYYEQTH